MKELHRQASANIVIALAGNKADLSSKRMIEYEVGVKCFKNKISCRFLKVKLNSIALLSSRETLVCSFKIPPGSLEDWPF